MLRITATLALASSLAAADPNAPADSAATAHAALAGATWASPARERQCPLAPEGQTQLRFKRKFELTPGSWKGALSWRSDSDCAVSAAGPAAAGGAPALVIEGGFTLNGPPANMGPMTYDADFMMATFGPEAQERDVVALVGDYLLLGARALDGAGPATAEPRPASFAPPLAKEGAPPAASAAALSARGAWGSGCEHEMPRNLTTGAPNGCCKRHFEIANGQWVGTLINHEDNARAVKKTPTSLIPNPAARSGPRQPGPADPLLRNTIQAFFGAPALEAFHGAGFGEHDVVLAVGHSHLALGARPLEGGGPRSPAQRPRSLTPLLARAGECPASTFCATHAATCGEYGAAFASDADCVSHMESLDGGAERAAANVASPGAAGNTLNCKQRV